MLRVLRSVTRFFGIRPDPAFEEAVQRLRQLPDSGRQITRPELIDELRALANRRPETKPELIQLQAESFILGERIRQSPLCAETPHNVWHFLSDADIRFKDAAYGRAQIESTLQLICQWESSHGV